MKNNVNKKKRTKIEADILQLEKTIAESQKKIDTLKKEKTAIENSEIISLIRNASMSVDDIEALISEFSENKNPPTKVSNLDINSIERK